MKLKKQFKLDRVTSKELLYQPLNHIRIDGKEAVATDGHTLVRVPVELQATEPNNISIHVNAWKEATKHKATSEIEIESDKCIVNGETFEHPEQNYPNFKKVWPEPYKKKVEIALNAKFLLFISQALAANENNVKLTIEIDDEGKSTNGAILVDVQDSDGERGLLMPVRLNRFNDES